MHFLKKSIRLSSADPEILAIARRTFNRFYTKLQDEDSENLNVDRVKLVIFKLHQIKQSNFFWHTRYSIQSEVMLGFVSLQ